MKRAPLWLAMLLVLASCNGKSVTIVPLQRTNQNQTFESIIISGSDTGQAMTMAMAHAFETLHARIPVSVMDKETGISALLSGDASIAVSSRKISDDEMSQAKLKGLRIQEFIVARDSLGVVLNPNNSVSNPTLEQLGKIYRGELTNWKQLGGINAKITLYGRQATSGTFTIFQEAVVKDNYAPGTLSIDTDDAIVNAVMHDKYSIGYVAGENLWDSTGHVRNDIRVVPLPSITGSKPVSPFDETAIEDGRYPLSFPLYQYLSSIVLPGSSEDVFLRFEASPDGIAVIRNAKLYPTSKADQLLNENVISMGK